MSDSKKQNQKPARAAQPTEPIALANPTGGVKAEYLINVDDLRQTAPVAPDPQISGAESVKEKPEPVIVQAAGGRSKILEAEIQEQEARKEKGESIFHFAEGDIIINVLPKTRLTYQSSGLFGYGASCREEPDNSYRRPFAFICVLNNIIYLRRMKKGGIGEILHVSLEAMEDGWKLFEIPKNLTIDDVCDIPSY